MTITKPTVTDASVYTLTLVEQLCAADIASPESLWTCQAWREYVGMTLDDVLVATACDVLGALMNLPVVWCDVHGATVIDSWGTGQDFSGLGFSWWTLRCSCEGADFPSHDEIMAAIR